jgi:predicted permease
MLLYRTPERVWTSAQVASQLGTAPESAGMRLFLLAAAGLLESTGSADRQYRFSSDASPLAFFMTPLAKAYETDRDGVARLLYGSTPSPVKNFADAFKLKS